MYIFGRYVHLSRHDLKDSADFLAILYKGDNFNDFLFAFLHTKFFWKEVYFKMKELPPKGGGGGANCFLLE